MPPRRYSNSCRRSRLQQEEAIPSAALVELLAEFGIGPANARAALNRLSKRGILIGSRAGRRSYYRLAPGASDFLACGAHQIFSFGRDEEEWSGEWTVALFALNGSERARRYSLHAQLRWLGFAPFYDGTWISPRPVAAAARQACDDPS